MYFTIVTHIVTVLYPIYDILSSGSLTLNVIQYIQKRIEATSEFLWSSDFKACILSVKS